MIDLFTFGTPNGQKVSIALEEMEVPYAVHKVDISKGDQHKPDFLRVNPNAKIPAIRDGNLLLFESVAILIYLAEKTGKFLPQDPNGRYQAIAWALFQASGVGPMFGQYGHFSVYAKEKIPYAIERYDKESKRLMGVMDKQLASNRYLAGPDYTIADIATWPWVRGYINVYKSKIDEAQFPNLVRWYQEIEARPPVQKGLLVPA